MIGTITASAPFNSSSAWDKDFNGDLYNWTYRGAYSGCCVNKGWLLQLDTMPSTSGSLNFISQEKEEEPSVSIFPNPASTTLHIRVEQVSVAHLIIRNVLGEEIRCIPVHSGEQAIDISGWGNGIYFALVESISDNKIISSQIIHVLQH